jgi:hypothetical protein
MNELYFRFSAAAAAAATLIFSYSAKNILHLQYQMRDFYTQTQSPVPDDVENQLCFNIEIQSIRTHHLLDIANSPPLTGVLYNIMVYYIDIQGI